MLPLTQSPQSELFQDPRLGPDFQTNCWPRWNDKDGPPIATLDKHEIRCTEFLAGYYGINAAISKLADARREEAITAVLTYLTGMVVSAITELEALEDRYASVGFFGEPVMDGAYYRNIWFIRPELPRIFTPAASISSHIKVLGLEDLPQSELVGEPQIVRWSHGKVDL